MNLEQHLRSLLDGLDKPASGFGAIDTRVFLYELAAQPVWGQRERAQMDFISKRLDINGALHLGYLDNGSSSADHKLADAKWLELALALFGKAALWGMADDDGVTKLRRFNVLFKAMDIVQADWFAHGSDWAVTVEREWNSLLRTLPLFTSTVDIDSQPGPAPVSSALSVVPLTVLFLKVPLREPIWPPSGVSA